MAKKLLCPYCKKSFNSKLGRRDCMKRHRQAKGRMDPLDRVFERALKRAVAKHILSDDEVIQFDSIMKKLLVQVNKEAVYVIRAARALRKDDLFKKTMNNMREK
ncbi:MAG: hypothetical protein GY816_16180 [Cytophagales bacterium]|nr:hypothetical protein [Cytophagales bacterium]